MTTNHFISNRFKDGHGWEQKNCLLRTERYTIDIE